MHRINNTQLGVELPEDDVNYAERCREDLRLYVCGAVVWGTALQAGRSRVRFPMVSLEFLIDIIISVAIRPWGRFCL
jgi:hypothetical protein